MPGWDSLETASLIERSAQILALALLAATAASAVVLWHWGRSGWPIRLAISNAGPLAAREWRLTARTAAVAGAVLLTVAAAAELAALGYGQRRDRIAAAVDQSRFDQLRVGAEAQARRSSELAAWYRSELAALRQRLREAEKTLAALQEAQAQKRLNKQQKQVLIEALKPFAGQKVAIASILGDEDGKLLVEDLIEVLDAAGWDHAGEDGVTEQQWERDPVGVEVTLNEDDARAGRISAGAGTLINVVRELGLVRGNSVYMSNGVPAGEILLKVGRKPRQ